jgi:hypothetical protein
LRALKKLESPLLQDSLSGTHQNEGQANKTEEVRTKRRKVLYEAEEQKITPRYPIFKPVSLPDFQIGDDSREKTDSTRLFAYVKANANDPEFFIQKAIGWALRSYARTDEQSVRNFLKEIKLSPLAVREAMRRPRKMFD